MKRKLVWVRWRDACSAYRTIYADEMETYDALTDVETVGLFVKEDAESLTLAVDYMPDQGKWRDIIGIPKVNIVKRKVFSFEP